MDEELYTDRVKSMLQLARETAMRCGNDFIGSEHLFIGILTEGGGVAIETLRNLGVSITDLMNTVEKSMRDSGGMIVNDAMLKFTPRAKMVLGVARQESRYMSHKYVGTEHLLLALIKDIDGCGRFFPALKITYDMAKEEILRVLQQYKPKAEERKTAFSQTFRCDCGAVYEMSILARKVEPEPKPDTLEKLLRDVKIYCAGNKEKSAEMIMNRIDTFLNSMRKGERE